jgi:N6-adenosine-specific RNA methylase IME4
MTGLAEKTLSNVRAIGSIDESRRRESVSFTHHGEVVGLAPSEQDAWLERAETEGWSARELRQNIKAYKRTKVIEGQARLEGQYRVIYADPPWSYGDRPPSGSGAAEHYPTMSIEDICKLPVAAHVERNAVLFMWVTTPWLLLNPGPREVIEAWGFEYKTALAWDKVLSAGGHYVAVKHEHLLICTRGSCLPDRPTPSPDSVQVIRRSGVHSEKPAEFRQLIEKLYDGPYLELFGRAKVPGWTVFGNDARLWGG